MKNAPYFPLYTKDALTDPEAMLWDMESFGAYWKLIFILWENGGTFEENDENFRKVFNLKSKIKAKKLWNIIKVKFVIENGIITHKRVKEEMQSLTEYRIMKSEAGKIGAKARWQSHDSANGSRMILPLANGMAKNGSSPSPSPSYIKEKNTSSFLNEEQLSETFNEIEENDGPNPHGELAYRFIELSLGTHNANKVLAIVEEAVQSYGYDAVKAAIEKVGPEAMSFNFVITHLRNEKREKEKQEKKYARIAELTKNEERRKQEKNGERV